jgi:deoxyhypusine synthase
MQWKKESIFNKWCWPFQSVEELNRSMSITLSKIQLKRISDVCIKSDTLNLTEEKIGNILDCISTEDNFLDRAVSAGTKSTINQLDQALNQQFIN